MLIVFRVDSSIKIGIGHTMRCLTLADEFKRRGATTLFIVRTLQGNIYKTILKRGHEYVLLSEPDKTDKLISDDDVVHANWLEVPWDIDAKETIKALGGRRPNWLVIDHYAIDCKWHKKLRSSVDDIFVIDDLADRVLDCDLLLDQTYMRNEDSYKNKVPVDCRMLLGSQFSVLKPEFSNIRPEAIKKRKKQKSINRILVAMGGMDPDNVTSKIIEGLALVEWKNLPYIDVVLNSNAPHLNDINKLARKHPLKITTSTDVDDMEERIIDADLAFGAGGTTSWERCCLGLPTIMTVNADNQKETARQLSIHGAVKTIGNIETVDCYKVKEITETLLNNNNLFKIMSDQSFKVTNGFGVKRVGFMIFPLYSNDGETVCLRPLRYDDAPQLYKWQSDPATRKHFENTDTPSLEDHNQWVSERVNNPGAITEVILCGDIPSGVVRLDPVDKKDDMKPSFKISIYVSPDKYKSGIGKAVIKIICDLMPQSELIAEVHESNQASHALFSGAGFEKLKNTVYVKNKAK